MRILFVCLGNICRSPTAEAVFDSFVEVAGLSSKIESDSAGTASYHVGEKPDKRTREHGQRRGYHFKSLARQFDPKSDFENFDYILTMDESNYQKVCNLDSESIYTKKIFRICEFLKEREAQEIPDPYYEGENGFELVLDLLEDACAGLLEKLKQEFR